MTTCSANRGHSGCVHAHDAPRLFDTVHFAPGRRSRMVQAADMLAFINRRPRTVTEPDPRAAENMNMLWAQVVGRRLSDQGSWP